MSAQELDEWLKSESSTSSGWEKSDGSGETVGHDSVWRLLVLRRPRQVLTDCRVARSLKS